jgi:hypothetical protein
MCVVTAPTSELSNFGYAVYQSMKETEISAILSFRIRSFHQAVLFFFFLNFPFFLRLETASVV